jgi:Domain of unknown function (DUF4276)
MSTKLPRTVTLFIEGTNDDTNGDLWRGFERLLKKELVGKMPIIKLCNGVNQTVNKFLKAKGDKFILIDLDGAPSTRKERLEALKLPESQTFFMVQSMEAWFLSQPYILKRFYNKSLKLADKPIQDIAKPDKELQRFTRDTRKKEYHKVSHAVELLGKLDIQKLQEDFSDVRDLIEALKKVD